MSKTNFSRWSWTVGSFSRRITYVFAGMSGIDGGTRWGGVTANIDRVYASQFTPAAQELQVAVVQLGDAQLAKIEASVADISNTSLTARWGLILFGICASLLGLVLSTWLVRSITLPIEQAVNTANQVASLDLTTHIEGHDRDEAGRLLAALGQMQSALHTLVDQVQGASYNVAEGATQIATGNLDFSNRTELAASFLQQTGSAIEEIAATMNASLEAATRGKALAQSANVKAASGNEIMSARTTFVAPVMWPGCRTGVWLIRNTATPNIAETIQHGSPYEANRNAGSSFTTRLHSAPKPRITLRFMQATSLK